MKDGLSMQVSEKSGTELLIDERRHYILSLLQQEGRVLIAALSEALGVSRITLRKDLDYLASRGLVRRTHGGALSREGTTLLNPTLDERQMQQSAEKARIARRAALMVHEGMCVILDAGSTMSAIARELRSFKQLTVISNSVDVASELSETAVEVILTGGTYSAKTRCLLGPLAVDSLNSFRADLMFLGAFSFDPKVGVLKPNQEEARVSRAMVQAASRVVVACDSTKFQQQSMALVIPPGKINAVITDAAIRTEDLRTLTAQEIEVFRV